MLLTLKTVFDWLSYISTVLVILSTAYIFILWLRGIVPVLVRLGNGLARRKIVIFAKGDMVGSLENLLHDSRLFNKTNISKIGVTGDVGKCEDASVFLVHWPDWKDEIKTILQYKKDSTAVVVYAPPGSIPNEDMAMLGNKRNLTVCNFRGRLLNDLVLSMITTSYNKK